MPLAILCSGQGNQRAGMFDLMSQVPAAEPVFAAASRLLGGRDARDLVRSAAPGELEQNRTAQILCTLAATSAWSALADVIPETRIVAGYSVGEVAAWHVAGVFSATQTLDLVCRRAETMDAASTGSGGLLFIRGLQRSKLDALCRQTNTAIAIVNPRDAYLVGGEMKSLEVLGDLCREAGAERVARVGVRVASHTPRLAPAAGRFESHLKGVPAPERLPTGVRLLSGVDGAAVFDLRAGLHKLALQISHTVDWAACLRSCVEAGATAFLELGPGRALVAMAGEISSHVEARALDDFKTLAGVKAWLARVA